MFFNRIAKTFLFHYLKSEKNDHLGKLKRIGIAIQTHEKQPKLSQYIQYYTWRKEKKSGFVFFIHSNADHFSTNDWLTYLLCVCMLSMVCKTEYKHMFIFFILFWFNFFCCLSCNACVYLLRFIIYSILSFLCDLIAFIQTHVLLIRLLFFYALRSCVCASERCGVVRKHLRSTQ